VYNNSEFAQPKPSFEQSIVPPSVDPDEGGLLTVQFSYAWLPPILGALTQLLQATTWKADDPADIALAQDRAMRLLNLFAATGASIPGIPVDRVILTRYNPDASQVEISFDGGGSWEASPGSDPRNQTVYPPQTGGDARCFSAASVIRKFQDDISAWLTPLTVGIDAAAFGAFIISTILDLGPFGILLDIAVSVGLGLISLGATAIEAALSPTVYDELLCILYTNMNADGQLVASTFAAVQSDVTSIIGTGDAGTIINLVFSLWGFGGINAAAALALDTDDCSECGWCLEYDATDNDGGWTDAGTGSGSWSIAGWQSQLTSGEFVVQTLNLFLDLGGTFQLTFAEASYSVVSDLGGTEDFFSGFNAGTREWGLDGSINNGDSGSETVSGGVPPDDITRLNFHVDALSTGAVLFSHAKIRGTGTAPSLTGWVAC
jgi:hypothetical protein